VTPPRRLATLGALALALAACGGPPVARPAPEAAPAAARVTPGGGLLIPAGLDVEAGARLVAEKAAGFDLVYLGEAHDDPQHHARQVAVLRAVLAREARPAVAFEMLPENDQELVDGALLGQPSAEEAGRRLKWAARGWPDFSMYWPLFAEAGAYRLPVVAADLSPATTRLIARSGLRALGAEGGGLGSALPPDPARETAIARVIHEAHCGHFPQARMGSMVESWHARNVTMARRVLGAMDGRLREAPGAPPPRVVMIVGAGHQAPGGLPDQVAALRPGARQLVVELRRAGAATLAGGDGGPGEIVWLTPGPARGDPCAASPSAPSPPRGSGGMGTGGSKPR
jgi:uncharacterized iron-regulated protein